MSLKPIPEPASNIDDAAQWIKSEETTSSAVYSKIPEREPSEASFIFAQISSYDVDFSVLTVKSTAETVGRRHPKCHTGQFALYFR